MQEHSEGHGTIKSYVAGFLISLCLTILAYFIAVKALFSGGLHYLSIAILGLVQAWVLAYLFLDVGKESKPQWNLGVFLFTILITLIIVVGSIWIMYHLNYNLMINEVPSG
jgi:cytochrome o ubiquinol oxidase subunit IV